MQRHDSWFADPEAIHMSEKSRMVPCATVGDPSKHNPVRPTKAIAAASVFSAAATLPAVKLQSFATGARHAGP
jgi:hypothetical protein